MYGLFKTFFASETLFHPNKPSEDNISLNCGHLIGKAWLQAATPFNAIGGFRGSGFFPLNPQAIPDSDFAIANINSKNTILLSNVEELSRPLCDLPSMPEDFFIDGTIITCPPGSPSLICLGDPNVISHDKYNTNVEEAIAEIEHISKIVTFPSMQIATPIKTSAFMKMRFQ